MQLQTRKKVFKFHALRILTCGYNTASCSPLKVDGGNNMISLHLIFGFVQHSHLNSDSRKSMILRIPLGNGVLWVFAAGLQKFDQHFQALLECSTHDRCESNFAIALSLRAHLSLWEGHFYLMHHSTSRAVSTGRGTIQNVFTVVSLLQGLY